MSVCQTNLFSDHLYLYHCVKNDEQYLKKHVNKKVSERLKKNKRLLNIASKLLLINVLPGALWKNEVDYKLNYLEHALMLQVIPGCKDTEIYEKIKENARVNMDRIINLRCRECGKAKMKKSIVCFKCGVVIFCSTKCQRICMEDKVEGHYLIDCALIRWARLTT